MNNKKYCSVCNIELSIKINWNISHEKNHRNICRLCYNKKYEEKRRREGIQKRKWNDGTCKKCGVILDTENFKEYNRKKHFYYCNICNNKISSDWRYNNLDTVTAARLKHKDKNLKRMREYARKNIIYTVDGSGNSIRIKTIKRPHTLICEMCHIPTKQTQYHHWDDLNPQWGIWVCCICHMFCEGIEKGLTVEQYLSLKRKIEAGEL